LQTSVIARVRDLRYGNILVPVIPFHVFFVVFGWGVILPFHLHFSGYGLTAYLWWADGLRSMMVGFPGMNAYNTPVACGLALCGYPLTWMFHFTGAAFVCLTISLVHHVWHGFGYLWLSWAAELIEQGWEKWEINTGITRCRPDVFTTVEQVCIEMMNVVNDQIMDVISASCGILSIAAILWWANWRTEQLERAIAT